MGVIWLMCTHWILINMYMCYMMCRVQFIVFYSIIVKICLYATMSISKIITHTQTLWILSFIYCLQRQENHVCAEWAFKNETGTYVEYVFRTPCLFSEHSRGQWRKTHTVYHIYKDQDLIITHLPPIELETHLYSVPCAWTYHFVTRKFQTYAACWPQTTGVIYNLPSSSSSSEGCGFYPWCYDCIQTNPPCYHRRNGETVRWNGAGKGGPFSLHDPTIFCWGMCSNLKGIN